MLLERQAAGRAQRAFPHAIVEEIAGLAARGQGSGNDRVDHRPDRAREGCVVGDDLAGRLDGAAVAVTENDDQGRAQNRRAVLERPHGGRIGEIAGVAGDEQLAEPAPAEHQLWRHAAVGTAEDRRPRALDHRRRPPAA